MPKPNSCLSYLRVLLLPALLLLGGCSSRPPAQPEDLCAIFEEKRDWYKAAKDMNEKWGTPVHVPMAMMYQESSFKHNARPPMRYWLGFIPIGRASDAYGYSQAKTMTWDDYQRETNSRFASRTNFADAIDFMGWFTNKTYQVNKVSKWDARLQYLNYHEGWTGYQRGTHNQKAWLIEVAGKVDARSNRYAQQYRQCKDDLDRSWLWRVLFS